MAQVLSLSVASVKSRLVLPFWYRLTQVVPEKRAVKRVCVCYELMFRTGPIIRHAFKNIHSKARMNLLT